MKKVKLLVGRAGNCTNQLPGQIVSLPDDEADRVVAAQQGEFVKDETKKNPQPIETPERTQPEIEKKVIEVQKTRAKHQSKRKRKK